MLQVMQDTNRNIKKSISKELPYEYQEYNKQKMLMPGKDKFEIIDR